MTSSQAATVRRVENVQLLSRSAALLIGTVVCACLALTATTVSVWLSFAALGALVATPFIIAEAYEQTR